MNCFSSEEYKGTSIISYSSLGDEITEPYKVLSLSALSLVVEIPLAISFVMFLLPTFIESQKINLELSEGIEKKLGKELRKEILLNLGDFIIPN